MNAIIAPDDFRDRAAALARSRKTLTLATTNGRIPWAAPVYFVFLDGRFYFFSDPDSRHMRDIEAAGRAAGAIFDDDGEGWETLRGIQMTGQVARVPAGRRALSVLRAYWEKFPRAAGIAGEAARVDLSFFLSRFRAHLYEMTPETVYYMDNTVRFGYRAEITLDC